MLNKIIPNTEPWETGKRICSDELYDSLLIVCYLIPLGQTIVHQFEAFMLNPYAFSFTVNNSCVR